MTTDPQRITVTENPGEACGTERFVVCHQAFPELRIGGPSVREAAQMLADRLTSELDAVTDPTHREPAEQAIADAKALIEKENSQSNQPR